MTDVIEEDILRGEQVASLKRNAVFGESIAYLKGIYSETWQKTRASDVEVREQCYYMMKALEEFESHFESVLQTGRLAKKQLDALKKGSIY